jgi:prepilin-type N-terminal cleavage/methylation domain-containing protein
MTRKVSGFSLIEMAIVLVIIGLVGGIALPCLKVMVDRQKASTTTKRLFVTVTEFPEEQDD